MDGDFKIKRYPMSSKLRKALRMWWKDANSDNPSKDVKISGLCWYIHSNAPAQYTEFRRIVRHPYPFGTASMYDARYSIGTQHLCPKRRMFVQLNMEE